MGLKGADPRCHWPRGVVLPGQVAIVTVFNLFNILVQNPEGITSLYNTQF